MADRDHRAHKYVRVNAVTTDATVTTVASYAAPIETIVLVRIDIIGVRATDGGWTRAAHTRLFLRSQGNQLVGGTGGEAEGSWTIALVDNAGTAEVRVTGAAATTIHWVGRVAFDAYECDITISGG